LFGKRVKFVIVEDQFFQVGELLNIFRQNEKIVVAQIQFNQGSQTEYFVWYRLQVVNSEKEKAIRYPKEVNFAGNGKGKRTQGQAFQAFPGF